MMKTWNMRDQTDKALEDLRQGTVAKSLQVGIRIEGINMDIRLAGFQLEVIPENRKTIVR